MNVTDRGPVFERIHGVLAEFDFFQQYRAGELSPSDYAHAVLAHTEQLQARGLPLEDIHFATRFPADPLQFAREVMQDLAAHDVIDNTDVDWDEATAHLRRLDREFDHGDNTTYIYPEEGLLIQGLISAIRPRSICFMGSYFGYWAACAWPAIRRHGGMAYLLDIDPAVSELSDKNIRAMGFEDCATAICGCAMEYVNSAAAKFDMFVIDAETARDFPDPELRGKAIYFPLLQTALGAINEGGTILCHNILMEHPFDDPFFDEQIARNKQDYAKFLPLAEGKLRCFREYISTEGVGIGRV